MRHAFYGLVLLATALGGGCCLTGSHSGGCGGHCNGQCGQGDCGCGHAGGTHGRDCAGCGQRGLLESLWGRHSGCCCDDAGPVAQAPPPPSAGYVAYPYYTNRGPRDFLQGNPQSIGP
jgi:hypothetical protein